MAFRTVVISSRCKLDYSLNYMIVKKVDSISTKVLLDEIRMLIINSTQIAMTTALISECIEKKIKIIFTDSKHNPNGELIPYYNNFYGYRKIKEQISFDKKIQDYLWMEIIKKKIINQANNLKLIDDLESYNQLIEYSKGVEPDDATHREGHSAKVYFNRLFGKDFNRDLNNEINMYLNYGYSIILSTINREIKILGYLTELGIHHIGESNPFNLSCDFMEPLRPLVDSYVVKGIVDKDNYKKIFIQMLSKEVKYNNNDAFLDNAIHLYVEDMIAFLKTGDISKIRFIEYEF